MRAETSLNMDREEEKGDERPRDTDNDERARARGPTDFNYGIWCGGETLDFPAGAPGKSLLPLFFSILFFFPVGSCNFNFAPSLYLPPRTPLLTSVVL